MVSMPVVGRAIFI